MSYISNLNIGINGLSNLTVEKVLNSCPSFCQIYCPEFWMFDIGHDPDASKDFSLSIVGE